LYKSISVPPSLNRKTIIYLFYYIVNRLKQRTWRIGTKSSCSFHFLLISQNWNQATQNSK